LIFERLAEDFKHTAVKLRQFIKEKHAVMRQAHFAGTRYRAASD
jgi:hypothetical protein